MARMRKYGGKTVREGRRKQSEEWKSLEWDLKNRLVKVRCCPAGAENRSRFSFCPLPSVGIEKGRPDNIIGSRSGE